MYSVKKTVWTLSSYFALLMSPYKLILYEEKIGIQLKKTGKLANKVDSTIIYAYRLRTLEGVWKCGGEV